MPVTTNTWLGATSGQPPLAQQPNSYLGVHAVQQLYTGSQVASQTTSGSGGTGSASTWIAQSFSTGSFTTIGYIVMGLSASTALGSSLSPLTVGIYANSAGAPTGAALLTIKATAEYVNPGPSLVVFPMPLTGLSASTTYWIVSQPAGTGGTQFTWNKSNQVTGTSTSANGSTWTAQAYGSLFQVFDQTASGSLQCMWEDSGARWQVYYYSGAGPELANISQYTTSQNGGYQQSYRTFTYASGILRTVS